MTLTEPQTWTIIGGFLAAIFTMLGVVTASLNRTLRAELGGLRTEIGGVHTRIDGVRHELRTEIGGVHTRIDGLRSEMGTKFGAIDRKLGDLDRDVQALTRHTFGHPD